MRTNTKLPSLSRVTAGSTATLEIPRGPTYHRIVFSATGTGLTASHIGRITVLIDGKPQQTYRNLQRLIDLNSYWGRSADSANEFCLHFYRREQSDAVYRRASGIGTQDVQTLHVEIEIDGTAPADLEITAHAKADPQQQPLGVFFKVREFPTASSVAGQVEVDKLPRGAYYGAIHLFKDDISAVEVEANGRKIVDATKSVLERDQKEADEPRTPLTAKATHVDWLTEGDLAQAIKTGELYDWRLKLNFDTPGSCDIITETLDVLG